MEQETRGQEIPQKLMYRCSWRPFWKFSWHLPVYEAFCLVKSKTHSLGTTLLKCQLIRISKLLNVRLKEFCQCWWLLRWPTNSLIPQKPEI